MGSLPVCTLERAGLVMLTVDLSPDLAAKQREGPLGSEASNMIGGDWGPVCGQAPLQTIFTTN